MSDLEWKNVSRVYLHLVLLLTVYMRRAVGEYFFY